MSDSAPTKKEEQARVTALKKARSGKSTSGDLSLGKEETEIDQKGNQLNANIKGAVELKSSRVTPIKNLGMKAALLGAMSGAAPQSGKIQHMKNQQE